MLFDDLVQTSAAVAGDSARLAKVHHLAEALRRARTDEVALAVAYLSGVLPQGRIGIGMAALRDARPASFASDPTLTLREVHESFERIAGTTGPGSSKARAGLLHDLLAKSTRDEQGFLVRLVHGELRQGAQEGVMVDAVASAASAPSRAVRRALMLAGDLGEVATSALEGGEEALARFGLRLHRPIKPMLAQSADSPSAALERAGTAAFEYKLDGARVQVHKAGGTVCVFSRRLNDVTSAVPEVVELVSALPASELVLDGEVIALDADRRPLPFQTTMRRFGRKLDVSAMRASIPLDAFFFDCLYIDGDSLLDRPTVERFDAMGHALPDEIVVPRLVTDSSAEADAFLHAARAAGHEGVMAKALDIGYEAGRRGRGWMKVKPVHTLDLVVLAAEWGHGRRRGWLSNLHLGARDPEGGFVMLGKTFKGLTDQLLEWQTGALQEIEVARDRNTVFVEPRLVVEIAFNDVQASTRYAGGLALRFARVKGYRPDKHVDDADTIDTVRAIHSAQLGGAGEAESD